MSRGLVGVIHLPPLPDSPRFAGRFERIEEGAARDAESLAAAGFEGVIVENLGDAPFYPHAVPPVTVAAMTSCALAVRRVAPRLKLGLNVLRNDAAAALSIAAVVGASMVRVNVHVAARVTDQGVIEGRAHETVRLRQQLDLEAELWCDVDVKHSAPLEGQPRPIDELTRETVGRGLADAVLVTGHGTGAAADDQLVDTVLGAADPTPVYVASGVDLDQLESLMRPRAQGRVAGVIVGSWLRADGRAGGPIDPDRAQRFAATYRRLAKS